MSLPQEVLGRALCRIGTVNLSSERRDGLRDGSQPPRLFNERRSGDLGPYGGCFLAGGMKRPKSRGMQTALRLLDRKPSCMPCY
jgi:hypothetical protein